MFLSAIVLLVYLHLSSSLHFLPELLTSQPAGQAVLKPLTSNKAAAKPVALEAHIMSKCPDAKDCLHDLIIPVMSQLSAHINLTISYIGTLSDTDDGVTCMHGPTECLGNILQLCAANEYPDPKRWLGFTGCTTDQYQKIPERALIEECAAEYGIEFEALNRCASRDDGQFGQDLLRHSVQRSLAAGVKTSCTVCYKDRSNRQEANEHRYD
jgi:hypothetical protein